MSTNDDLAAVFEEVANLLDLSGESFKPEAYRRAARSLSALPEDVRKFADRGELRSIPGVGEAIQDKIREYLREGRVSYLGKLRTQFPPGLLDLMHRPGLGPKTARRLWVELQIEGPEQLAQSIAQGRLNGLKGFGPKRIEIFRKAVSGSAKAQGRSSILHAWTVANEVVAQLRKSAAVDRIELAGSLRRRKETIGDLDILVTSRNAEDVFDAFTALPGVTEVKMRGDTKETIVYHGSLQIDLRVLAPESFGAAWQYFTGSKEHNVHLRSMARDQGLKINEYGVFRGTELIAGRSEEDVYATLNLPWIPPEIRENQGEIELAAQRKLPPLVERSMLRGDLHVHVDSEPSAALMAKLSAAAQSQGWSYLGLVGGEPNSGRGSGPARPKVGPKPPASAHGPVEILHGFEGTHPPADDAGYDYWVYRPKTKADPPPRLGESPRPVFAAHLEWTGEEGPISPPRIAPWTSWSLTERVALEVAPSTELGGLDSVSIRRATEQGGSVILTAAADQGAEFERIELSIGLARRGWAAPDRVLNVRKDPLGQVAGRPSSDP